MTRGITLNLLWTVLMQLTSHVPDCAMSAPEIFRDGTHGSDAHGHTTRKAQWAKDDIRNQLIPCSYVFNVFQPHRYLSNSYFNHHFTRNISWLESSPCAWVVGPKRSERRSGVVAVMPPLPKRRLIGAGDLIAQWNLLVAGYIIVLYIHIRPC